MAELEKLEEAFGKCKSDCTQLCLSLNEEKNLNRKLSTELEALKARLKEVDASEARLDKAEQALTTEMERLKGLTQTFLSERKRLLEKQKEDRELILKLTDKLEQQKNRISSADYSRRDSRDIRIEDELSTGLSSKLARKKSLDYLKITDDTGLRNKAENEKNSLEGQEDNKVRDLNQEVERLKNRLKQLELVEEDLKDTVSQNSELLEKFQQEKIRSQTLAEQVEQLKMQIYGGGSNGGAGNGTAKVLENGKVENEDTNVRGAFRQEKPKYRSAAATDPIASKYKSRDVSPQYKREPKLRNKDLSQSAESSPKSVRRALSPAQKNRRGLKTIATPASDNGLKEMEKAVPGSQVSNIDSKKVSVLSRYPPAANDQKSWKTPLKASDGDSKKSQMDKFSRLFGGSDSESNSSDVMPATSSKALAALSAEKDSEQRFANPSQDSSAVLSLSKANGSYTAYRSHVSPVVVSDQGSEGHSSASESESTGSRPSVGDQESSSAKAGGRSTNLKYSRHPQIHSDRSSTRSSYEEEGHKALMAEGSQEASQTLSGIEIRRVCSPREALRSKAVIKPAIVEIDRKEVMSGSGGGTEPLPSTGKPKISTKPVLTSKMTSSITIYPNDLSSSRTSSRSSSVCSEPIAKERHTSTSNIIISPSSEHRGGLSIPYEISIPKSEITLRHCQDGADDDGSSDPPSVTEMARVETHLRSRSSFNLQSPESISDFNNDGESGFESSSSSSTTTVTSWRSHNHNHQQQHHHHHLSSQDDSLPEMRNVTVRSTWKNRGALSVDEVPRLDGSEDECESTWRAYRATTVLDAEEVAAPVPPSHTEGRGGKLSPAEVYMRRITSSRDAQEPGHHPRVRGMTTSSSDSGLGRTVPHEPVSAKERQPWSRKHPTVSNSLFIQYILYRCWSIRII